MVKVTPRWMNNATPASKRELLAGVNGRALRSAHNRKIDMSLIKQPDPPPPPPKQPRRRPGGKNQ